MNAKMYWGNSDQTICGSISEEEKNEIPKKSE